MYEWKGGTGIVDRWSYKAPGQEILSLEQNFGLARMAWELEDAAYIIQARDFFAWL